MTAMENTLGKAALVAAPVVAPIPAGDERATLIAALQDLRSASAAGLHGQCIKANLRALAAFEAMRERLTSELIDPPRLDPEILARITASRAHYVGRRFLVVPVEMADMDAMLTAFGVEVGE